MFSTKEAKGSGKGAILVYIVYQNDLLRSLRPLPDKGAELLRIDLEAAGIPYRDTSGLVFDFHALRCLCATLLDAAGVSPSVVQKLMRHSTLELTGRYTRPHVVDLDHAAGLLPTLRTDTPDGGTMAATGTAGQHIEKPRVLYLPTAGDGTEPVGRRRDGNASGSAGS